MKRIIAVGIILTLVMVASPSFASDVAITCDSMETLKDGTIAAVLCNLVFCIDAGVKMNFKSDHMRRNGNETVLEGDVTIQNGKIMIKTEKATMSGEDGNATTELEGDVNIQHGKVMIKTEKATIIGDEGKVIIKMDSAILSDSSVPG